MQPENTRLTPGPEQIPVVPAPNAERIPVLPSPESGLNTGPERAEQAAEASAAVADAATMAVPTVTPVTPTVTAPVQDDDGPLAAADQDVIEKEWVDKAKKIVAETKGDPHRQTSRVNQLQKAYLKKRYGKELGVAPQ